MGTLTDFIQRVREGDLLSAERDAQILDLIGRQTTGPEILAGTTGFHDYGSPMRKICRFEMTEGLNLTNSGAPSANAYFLNWVTPTAATQQYLMSFDTSDAVKQFYVGDTIVLDTDSSVTGVIVSITYGSTRETGTIVYDHMSGRAMLTNEDFSSTTGDLKSARVHWSAEPTPPLTGSKETIKVIDTLRMFSKPITVEPDVGAYGLAWTADDPPVDAPWLATWEILTMQNPGDFIAKLVNDLEYDDESAYVDVINLASDGEAVSHVTFDGYDLFGPAYVDGQSSKTARILVRNPKSTNKTCGDYMFGGNVGDHVYCKWHHRIGTTTPGTYVIVYVENNNKDYIGTVVNTPGGNATIYSPPWAPPT